MTNTEPDKNAVSALPGTDRNQRRLYEVTVHRTDYYYTTIVVGAPSEQQAEEIGEELASGLPASKWEVADRDLYAFKTQEVVKGGKKNE